MSNVTVLGCAALLLAAVSFAAAPDAAAQGFGSSFGGLQVTNDQPISIESDKLDVDDSSSIATFTGNVSVSQGETQLKTGKLLVYYAQNDAEGGGSASALPGGPNQIEKLVASDKVYIKSADQVATADEASFDMGSQVVVMTGNVVLSQGENVATGCMLTIHMDTGLASLQSQECNGAEGGTGRVKMMLTPQGDAASN